MKRLWAYWLALKPRTGFWFFLQIVALTIPTPVTLAGLWRFAGIRPSRAEVWPMLALELGIIVLVLFISGFVAWGKEREKNHDRWPRLSPNQRIEIVKKIRPFNAAPGLFVCAKDADDCFGLAVDLCDVVSSATNGRFIPIPKTRQGVPSGIVITVRPEDRRGPAIQAALKAVAGIKAHLEIAQDEMFAVFIGPRVS